MRKTYFTLACLFSILPFNSLFAAELELPAAPASVEVPSVPAPAMDTDAAMAEYREYFDALKTYSDIAFITTQGSPAYMEATAAGQYLRGRLEAMGERLGRNAGFSRETLERIGRMTKRPVISFNVLNELDDVFGFYSGSSRESVRGVPIKAGYCQINYVKNNTPFLVQYDGFLNKGEVILTFDDGPGALTEEVSAAMKEGGAPSIFFVLGRNIAGETGKARIKAEAADGHAVAVHGYNHAAAGDKPFTAMSTEEAVKQMGGVKGAIKETTGSAVKFFRPPYGIITVEQLKAADSELGLIPVGWTIDTLDWSTKDPDALFQNTVKLIQQRGKGIVLMHDIHPQSRTAAKRLVKWLAENGYKVVSPERIAKAYRGE